MNSRPYLEYVLTDHDTHQPVHLDAKRADIFDLMRASSALPHIYPLPVTIAGRDFYDGGQSDPIPVQRAIESGASHIVVVRTRPVGYEKNTALALAGEDGAAGPLQRISAADRTTHRPDTSIVSFNPTTMFVGRLTRSRRRITAAIDHGKDVANRVIDAHPAFFEQAIGRRESGSRRSARGSPSAEPAARTTPAR